MRTLKSNVVVEQYFITAHYFGSVINWSDSAPRVIDFYETTRCGELQRFSVCTTQKGDILVHEDVRGNKALYTVIINELVHGDAENPDEYVFVAKFKRYVF